jgi:5-methylcytosine-specific restriction endonuclease McrA
MLNLGVLVLNRSYLPIHVTTVRRAFALVYQGAAHVVDSEYRSYAFDEWFALAPEQGADTIGTSRGPIPVPKVIVLRSYDRMPRRHVRFSRANVFARDDHTCQYCGERYAKGDLNLDHVVPRSHGGRSTWENVVTSCVDCNRRKGGRTPEQAGFRLNKKPARPRWTPLASLPLASHRHDEWRPFLRVVDRSEAREPIAV